MTDNDEDPADALYQIFDVCASLIDKALSMPTLTSTEGLETARPPEEDSTLQLSREELISRWMDRQILEYESRLYRRKNSGIIKTRLVPSVELWRQLTDDSLRIEQERLLLRSILHSRVAHHCEALDSGGTVREVQDAVQRQSTEILEKQSTLRDIQTKIARESARLECLRKDCEIVWKRISTQQRAVAVADNNEALPIVTKDSLVMERIMMDLVVGANLDWDGDARLRGIVEKLQNK